MTTIFVRTIIIYVILLTSMRLMGKRQIGQLDISDLITTLLISEIAALPITNLNVPISHAVIPIIILLTFEVISSAIQVRFPFTKKLISATPTTLIRDGKLSYEKMKRSRITADELISVLRQNNITDISEVDYAILEANGRISVMPKPEFCPPTSKDLKLHPQSKGIYHIVMENGCTVTHGMEYCSLSDADVNNILKKNNVCREEVYLLLVNDSKEIQLIRKDNK